MPPHPISWRSILILSSHLCPGLPSDHFLSGFRNKTLFTPLLSPICTTCPAHLILLNLITQTIFGEQYRSLSSCGFPHSPVTSSLLGPNMIQPTPHRIFSHCQMSRNFKSKKFELQQFTPLGSDLGSVSACPYVHLQVLLPHSNLFSARPFRRYTLPSLTTHWTLPSLPQVIKNFAFPLFLCGFDNGLWLTNTTMYSTSVSHLPGRGLLPGTGINYTGPWEVLLEFAILFF